MSLSLEWRQFLQEQCGCQWNPANLVKSDKILYRVQSSKHTCTSKQMPRQKNSKSSREGKESMTTLWLKKDRSSLWEWVCIVALIILSKWPPLLLCIANKWSSCQKSYRQIQYIAGKMKWNIYTVTKAISALTDKLNCKGIYTRIIYKI